MGENEDVSGDIEDVDIVVSEVSSASLAFLSLLSEGRLEDVLSELSEEGLEDCSKVGLSFLMFSSSSTLAFPERSLDVEVEVSVESVLDFRDLADGASVNGTEGKNTNDLGDGGNDVTGV